MANILPMEKKIAAVAALAEGTSIRSVERMTGVHRDTIMRLGVRVGQGCTALMDTMMRDLTCERLQLDEIWQYVGKHQKRLTKEDDESQRGDFYTFVALDADTKLVPAFLTGKRDAYNTICFVEDLAARLSTNRVQVSTDAMNAYASALERGFGCQLDYAQITKVYRATELAPGRYSPPDLYTQTKSVIYGNPDPEHISTSYVESQNLTMRMHCRRLTRLTNAYSKKLENFKAAIGLYFGYYNFVKMHSTIRSTPAMAAGVTDTLWTVADLVEKTNA
jgi:IS1 family transposase